MMGPAGKTRQDPARPGRTRQNQQDLARLA
jgi:hypothetical protein